MIAVIDYGMGNLRSVQKAFAKIGADALVTQNPADIEKCAKIVLPGVGAMQPAMEKLHAMRLAAPLKKAIENGKPFLGICLGLQLLFEESDEGGTIKGLGIFPGRVRKFTKLRIPHMGWNQINIEQPSCALFAGIKNLASVYFCHSYFVNPEKTALTAAKTDYGIDFTSAIGEKNVFGVQFHPEKSQAIGLKILKNFAELKS